MVICNQHCHFDDAIVHRKTCFKWLSRHHDARVELTIPSRDQEE